jgi:glycosyltransferase involved in cell wall biosynthesis
VTSGKLVNSKILYVTPYSKNGPVHGGKIRARKIADILGEIDSDLEVVDLGDRDYRYRPSKFDLTGIPQALIGDLEIFERDYALSEEIYGNLKLIVFEQPWSWVEVKELKKKYPNSKIVYSSQNIEFQLKDKILTKYLGNQAKSIVEEIRKIEMEIATAVDRVVVVSEIDQDWYSQFTKLTPILAPNGAEKRVLPAAIRTGSNLSRALVVGSAHPPNIEGCLKFLSDPDLWMPPNSQIVVAGSLATALFDQWGQIRNRWGASCVQLIPEVTDSDLTDLLEECNVILLPIAYGGGTNLKTAEALVSGRPIVGSLQAFRGFENFAEEDAVKIAQTNIEFKILTCARLIGSRIATRERETSNLLWNSTLQSLASGVLELIND